MAWDYLPAGYIALSGLLYCHECWSALEYSGAMQVVYTDTFPACEEACERCQRVVMRAQTSEKVQSE